jgi:hypothetical protein
VLSSLVLSPTVNTCTWMRRLVMITTEERLLCAKSSRSQILLIIGNFSQHGFLAAILQIVLSSCDYHDVVKFSDNNCIRHHCEELVQ